MKNFYLKKNQIVNFAQFFLKKTFQPQFWSKNCGIYGHSIPTGVYPYHSGSTTKKKLIFFVCLPSPIDAIIMTRMACGWFHSRLSTGILSQSRTKDVENSLKYKCLKSSKNKQTLLEL